MLQLFHCYPFFCPPMSSTHLFKLKPIAFPLTKICGHICKSYCYLYKYHIAQEVKPKGKRRESKEKKFQHMLSEETCSNTRTFKNWSELRTTITCSVQFSRSVVSDSLQTHGLYRPWNSPGQNTGVGSLSLLQWIFPIQGSNPGLPHCGWILY